MLLGSHVSIAGKGLLAASEEAASYGANTFMLYTGAPQNTIRKSLEKLFIEEGKAHIAEHGMSEVVVHAPYIINLASHKPNTFELAVEFLRKEIDRTTAFGSKYLVLHPGAYTEKDVDYGINRIVEGLQEALTKDQEVLVCLETMAGKGSEIGRTFEEIARILEATPLSDKLAVCFDTCHTHDAGYDVVNDFDGVLAEFDRIIGLDRLKVFHINDSKNPRGAAKDRHANVGEGHIGLEALRRVVAHEIAQGKPCILETPWIGEKGSERPPYKEEIALLRAVR